MACTSANLSAVLTSPVKDSIAGDSYSHAGGGLRVSASVGDFFRHRFQKLQRSRSEPLLFSSHTPFAAPSEPTIGSSSAGSFPFHFLFDSEANKEMQLMEEADGSDVEAAPPVHELGDETRANWVERLLELRTQWRGRRGEEAAGGSRTSDEEEEEQCHVAYESEEESEEGGGERTQFDREAFSKLLVDVPWGEIKLFSQLAFLCNVAYVIPQLKAEDLRNYYDLRWVTSSLDKKAEASAVQAKLEADSAAGSVSVNRPPAAVPSPEPAQKRPNRPAAAYGIAASAASYVHSRTMGPTASSASVGDGHAERGGSTRGVGRRAHESEMAAHVATSTMTAVVAAGDAAKQEAARALQSLHSSPCEWFVCDDPSTCTRYFVIQGSDSLASWQANLFFDPTEFEGTDALVHRGIYEAAKGIYEQFMPEIVTHLRRHGERARLRFTGHSLGGSLSLLVHLMLLARGVVAPATLLPVVTFGSPFVFCGGRRVLRDLGVEEGQVCCVVMHRDIVPRAFSCSYPESIAQVLRRLSRAFRSHPCLYKENLLYSPMGKLYILQPDDKFSPPHPLLPPGCALYALDGGSGSGKPNVAGAVRAFLDNPHPLETLSHLAAYGSEGAILRDHDSSNYLKAVNGVLRRHTRWVLKRMREQRVQHWWPLLTMTLRDHPPWDGHRHSAAEPESVVTGA